MTILSISMYPHMDYYLYKVSCIHISSDKSFVVNRSGPGSGLNPGTSTRYLRNCPNSFQPTCNSFVVNLPLSMAVSSR